VSFPNQLAVAALKLQEVALQLIQNQIFVACQSMQMREFVCNANTGIQDGHINNQSWQFESGRWPGVNFVVQHQALIVVGRQIHRV
jgi:hypothetical protein